MADTDQGVELSIDTVLQIQKNISEGLDVLATSVSYLKGHLESTANRDFVGTIPSMQHDLARKAEFENTFMNLLEQVNIKNQEVVNLIRDVYCTLNSLVECLTKQITEWQAQFQLYYAKLMAQPDLEKIAPSCAQVGLIIQQLLVGSFAKWETILKQIPVNVPEMFLTEYQTQQSAFQSLMTNFLQSTFLVTEQGEFFIKTLKKCFPSFRIRVLAADRLFDHSGEVTAHFISESNLRECFNGDGLDIEALKKKEIKVTVNKNQKSHKKLALKSQRNAAKMECSCESLQFERQFKRQQAKETKVHEEKFRVVFVTKIESKTLWTVSLPLVVITASNQEAASLASIMWQCTSTNVFSIKEVTPAELKWSTVAWMLKQKISVISPSRSLTRENLTHLKNRLFGRMNQSDDALVSLTQFCWVPMKGMKDASVSFWKWFLGIFNIIQDYLSDYWNDGLIMGFVKRQDAEKMLLQCQHSGTFILRFSDYELSDSDGLKNVQGHLRASVFCIKLNKTKDTGKRNSTGQQELLTERVIENLELKDPPENLANILKDERKLLYCYLYPGDKSREELFDKYYEAKEENIHKIYRKADEVEPTIDDLQRTLKGLNLARKIASSNPDPSLQSEPRMIKKPKRSNKIPISDEDSVNGQENSSSDIATHNHNPLNTSAELSPEQSSMSPGYLDRSPLQSVPAPTFHGNFMDRQNQDSVVPDVHQSMNDFDLSLGGASSQGQSGRIIQQMNVTDTLKGGAGWPDDDVEMSKESRSFLVHNNNLLFGGFPGQHPIHNDGHASQMVENCVYEAGASEKQAVSLTFDSLESSSKLSASTLNELKQNLQPNEYGMVLRWTNKEEVTGLAVANAAEFGDQISDIPYEVDGIEADGLFNLDDGNFQNVDETLEFSPFEEILSDDPMAYFDRLLDNSDNVSSTGVGSIL